MEEVNFNNDLEPETKSISKASYRMTLIELKKLKTQLKELLDYGFKWPNAPLICFRELNKVTIMNKYPLSWIHIVCQAIKSDSIFED